MKVLLWTVVGLMGVGALWVVLRFVRYRRSLDQPQPDVSPEWLVEHAYDQDGDEPWR